MKGKDQKTVYTRSQEQEQHQEKDNLKMNILQQQKQPIPLLKGKEGPNK